MYGVISSFRLIRFQNLIIMALTMILVKWCLIDTLLGFENIIPAFSLPAFILLTVSTLLIASGGYVVNDYLDADIDEINKAKTMVIGKSISKNAAWNLYIVLCIGGLVAAVYPAYESGNINFVLIQIISAGLLWFYSYSYKRQLLIGNLVISVLSALVVFLPAYYEAMAEKNVYQQISINFFYVNAFTAFAFLTTFSREIIKDMEDMEGDKSVGCRTFPIVAGIVPAKILAVFFSILVMAAVGYIQYSQYESQDYISLLYFLVAVQLPSALLTYKTATAKHKTDFRIASRLSKLVMIGGILSMLVFKYTL